MDTLHDFSFLPAWRNWIRIGTNSRRYQPLGRPHLQLSGTDTVRLEECWLRYNWAFRLILVPWTGSSGSSCALHSNIPPQITAL